MGGYDKVRISGEMVDGGSIPSLRNVAVGYASERSGWMCNGRVKRGKVWFIIIDSNLEWSISVREWWATVCCGTVRCVEFRRAAARTGVLR